MPRLPDRASTARGSISATCTPTMRLISCIILALCVYRAKAAPVVAVCSPPTLGCTSGTFCDGVTLSCIDVRQEDDACTFAFECDSGLMCSNTICTATSQPAPVPDPAPSPQPSGFPTWSIAVICVIGGLSIIGAVTLITMVVTKTGCFAKKQEETLPEMIDLRDPTRPETAARSPESQQRSPSTRPKTSHSHRPHSSRSHSSRRYYKDDYKRDHDRQRRLDWEQRHGYRDDCKGRREWERREHDRRQWERRAYERRMWEQRSEYEAAQRMAYEAQRRDWVTHTRALSAQGYLVRAANYAPSGATTFHEPSRPGSAENLVMEYV